MNGNLIFIPTSENIKYPPAIMRNIMDICQPFCYIVFISDTSNHIIYPQRPSFGVHTILAEFTPCKIYNNGDINLCLSSDSVIVDTAMLYNFQKVYEISCLAENWNGNGAQKFSAKLMNSIKAIIESVDRQPNIFPTARESIQLEYENDDGDYLEFEIFESGNVKKFYCNHDGEHTTEEISAERINEVVNNFYEFRI